MRSGNNNALAQLYQRYHLRLQRYCVRLLRNEQRAEDTVQNVFLKLQTDHKKIRCGDALQSWLFTVARNEVFSELRKKKDIVLDDTMMWDGELPDDILLRQERKEMIEIALQRLHAPFREVILLREYEHLSYEEIAQITETTVSSVKSRLFKARKALIEKLKPYVSERNV